MLNPDDVVFEDRPYKGAPDVIRMTWGDVSSSPNVLQAVLGHGIKRLLDSIRDSEKKEPGSVYDKQLARMNQIRAGELWSRGGGSSVSTEDYIRRDELAGWVMKWLGYSKAEAEKLARKDATALHAVGTAIYRHNHGTEPDDDTAAEAACKVQARVQQQVDKRLAAQSADDLDI